MNFYLLVTLILGFNLLKRINVIIVAGIIIYFIANFYSKDIPYFFYIYKYIFIYNNVPLFFAGILFYKYTKQGESKGILLLLLSLNFWVYAYFHELEYIIALGLFYILFSLTILGNFRFVVNKITMFFGSISYALYLIHQNIGYIVLRKVQQIHLNIYLGLTLTIALVVLLAYLITFFVEKPLMIKIRQKFGYN
jgi:peptidoglycan/LPS O-acetylase OafA/YrhL